MKFALFNQLQMPIPWRENAKVLISCHRSRRGPLRSPSALL